MICRYDSLRRHASVFLRMTGLHLTEFEALLDDMLPRVRDAELTRGQRERR
jgi:hypothetical protein